MKHIKLGIALLLAAGAATAQGVNHAPFDALLRTNVRNGVVNYPGFQNNPSFKGYIEALAQFITGPVLPCPPAIVARRP